MPRVMVLVHCTSPQWDLICLWNFKSVAWIFSVMPWTKFRNKNEQRTITPKVWSFELRFLCTVLLLNRSIYLKFHVNALHSFKVMLRTKFKIENEERAITPKVWCLEFWFLCTALFLNEIYLPMKFQDSSLNTYWVMLQTNFNKENEQRAKTIKICSFEL